MLLLELVPSAIVAAINVIVIASLILGAYIGFKKGFLESGIKFVISLIALIAAYGMKNPVSVLFYTYLPFFKMKGIFQGVSVINIIIYELLAYIITFILLEIIINIVCKVTGLLEKMLSAMLLIGLSNKLLGLVLGMLQSVIILFFASCALTFGCNIKGYELEGSFTNNILNLPVLKNTVGTTFTAFQEILSISDKYESITVRDDYNYDALDVLLKYNVITVDNAEALIKSGKIEIPNDEALIYQHRNK